MENTSIHEEVVIVPWQECWAVEFHLEKEFIIASLLVSDHYAEIIHVGSTSVKGMYSKPIIDILVCPDEGIDMDDVITDLTRAGYTYVGECRTPGCYFLSKGDEPNQTFYVHVCSKDHPVARDQLLFQHIERTNETVFENYLCLKLRLARLFPDDRIMYRALKEPFIEGVLAVYRSFKKQ